MKKSKYLALFLTVVMAVSVFAACNKPQLQEAAVSIKITDLENNEMYSGEVTVKSESPTLFEAMQTFLDENDIPYTLDKNGNAFEMIDEVVLEGDNYWEYKLNGAVPSQGAKVVPIKTGDKIVAYRAVYEPKETK